jgi:hypothetical protein
MAFNQTPTKEMIDNIQALKQDKRIQNHLNIPNSSSVGEMVS